MTWAFDADALIYAADPGNDLGAAVRRVLHGQPGRLFGSVLLVAEVLVKPRRDGQPDGHLLALLARLDLADVTRPVVDRALVFGAEYGLRTNDAVHLATAVHVGADYFVTNHTRDFRPDRIAEVDVVTPEQL